MLTKLKTLMRAPEQRPHAAIPEGQRVYAIGDIHGRLDLFEALIAAIEADDDARPHADTMVVLLGDLIDRGPDSAGVIAAARAWARRRPICLLRGNHEEMLLLSLENEDVLRAFLRYGGLETLLSYPIDMGAYDDAADLSDIQRLLIDAISAEDLAFLDAAGDYVTFGDYLFVHAGIKPGVPLLEQLCSDVRWIREPFLSYPGEHGYVVVHGHTVVEEPAVRPNRIGIDTGAYFSGRLTVLGLQGTERWLIETAESELDGRVTCQTRSIG